VTTAPHFVGAHTIDNGGIHMAVKRAASAGMTALQVFTAKPQFYNEKISVRPERVERFRTAIDATAIRRDHVVAHGAYVLNVATPDEGKWVRARDGLAKELERSTALGIGIVCFHPGAATDGDRGAAAKRIAAAIVHALEAVPRTDTRLLVENTAGAGATMARTAAEIGEILRHVPKPLRQRTGFGLDTCHLWASGYDIAQSQAALTAVLDEFEQAAGEPPGFFHLNDSGGDRGSNRDRHALIGDGTIGAAAFGWLMKDPRSRGVPLVLETPQLNMEIAEDDASPDPYDVQMLVLLRELAEGSQPWAIPWPCAYEFFSVVTNRRIWKESASTPEQAWLQLEAWFEAPSVRVLSEPSDFPALLGDFARRPRVRGRVPAGARR
jgi:deoxyribonuclease IV